MASSLHEYLASRRHEIDLALERYLPTPPDCPPLVHEAMKYSLMAGGKRLRPVLTLASAEAVAESHGLPVDRARSLALPAACAVEMIHTYSLIHDDLPAMDDDVLRRGRPTVHVVYGEGLAILAGDGLQAQAFALLATEPSGDGELPGRRLRAIERIALAAGPAARVRGLPEVRLLDLSLTGAQIEHLDLLRPRLAYTLDLLPPCGAPSHPAQVVWCAVIGRKRKVGSGSHLVARSGLQFRTLTAAQQAALADTLQDLAAALAPSA